MHSIISRSGLISGLLQIPSILWFGVNVQGYDLLPGMPWSEPNSCFQKLFSLHIYNTYYIFVRFKRLFLHFFMIDNHSQKTVCYQAFSETPLNYDRFIYLYLIQTVSCEVLYILYVPLVAASVVWVHLLLTCLVHTVHSWCFSSWQCSVQLF